MLRFRYMDAAAASRILVGFFLFWSMSSSTSSSSTASAFSIGRDLSSYILHSRRPRVSSATSATRLFLAKSRNKQAALKQKLEEARRQKLAQDNMEATTLDDSLDTMDSKTQQQKKQQQVQLSDDEIRIRNDRLRFEELLKKGYSSSSLNEYLTVRQEEAEIDAVQSGIDRIFEGDPAPEDCFEELVSIKSENAIGATGKQRLVPWLHKNAARHDDFLVILSDPRRQSPEFRATVKTLLMELPADIVQRLVFVNADSPAENRRWLKKSRISDEKITLFSDEKMEWMRRYTALGEKRWGMTMFVIANRRVQKLARDIDQYGASRTVQNAVKTL